MTKVGIIGTAARQGQNITRDMLERASLDILLQLEKWSLLPDQVTLVSGGSAWSDHLAVTLYLAHNFKGLTLHLPCAWKGDKFDNSRCGRRLNTLHQQHSEKVGEKTLYQLQEALETDACFTVSPGFKARNVKIAKSEYLIAMTVGQTLTPGTAQTYALCKSKHKQILPFRNKCS